MTIYFCACTHNPPSGLKYSYVHCIVFRRSCSSKISPVLFDTSPSPSVERSMVLRANTAVLNGETIRFSQSEVVLHSNLQNLGAKKKRLFLRMIGEYGPRSISDGRTFLKISLNIGVLNGVTRHNSADSVPTSNLVCIKEVAI